MQTSVATESRTYNLDPNHSTVHFWVRHMMVAKVHGELSDITGSVSFDPQHPEKAEVSVQIDANSLTTRNEQRDAHLKSGDFLDVEHFPTIEFKTTAVRAKGDNTYALSGDLTIHGTTREVTLEAELTPEVKGHFGGFVMGVSAQGIIDREQFGITWNQALETGGVLVGKEIHVQIDAELQRAE